jgi:2-oxo-4-hydroxy-4-carboxy-5-ureidoimidazoline decarboxylase
MNLHDFNILPKPELTQVLLNCCGSSAWVQRMLPFIPADDIVELLEDAEEQWWKCTPGDWKEAFSHHPKIGDVASLEKKFGNAAQWSASEQGNVASASKEILEALGKGNRDYEAKFGYIFIVCATGKSAAEMLALLQSRLPNDPEREIEIAADEQNKITKLRLEKLLDVDMPEDGFESREA